LVGKGVRAGPSLTASAFRYGLGEQVAAPPPELSFWILAKEFGIGPWEVAEAPLSEVLKALEILSAVRKGEAQRAERSNRP
jgi:hypothetical protein